MNVRHRDYCQKVNRGCHHRTVQTLGSEAVGPVRPSVVSKGGPFVLCARDCGQLGGKAEAARWPQSGGVSERKLTAQASGREGVALRVEPPGAVGLLCCSCVQNIAQASKNTALFPDFSTMDGSSMLPDPSRATTVRAAADILRRVCPGLGPG